MFDNIMSNVMHRLQQRQDSRASQDGLKAVPSKEEILNTLEQFGSDKDEGMYFFFDVWLLDRFTSEAVLVSPTVEPRGTSLL